MPILICFFFHFDLRGVAPVLQWNVILRIYFSMNFFSFSHAATSLVFNGRLSQITSARQRFRSFFPSELTYRTNFYFMSMHAYISSFERALKYIRAKKRRHSHSVSRPSTQ